jgi:hypothetical protein
MTISAVSPDSRLERVPVALDPRLVKLIGDKNSLKAIATSDGAGVPHVAFDPWIELTGNSELVHLEFHLDSTSSRNMIQSLWFDHSVSIAIGGLQGQAWRLTGIPVKAHVCGQTFQHYYAKVRDKLGDVDLAAVYLIRIVNVQDESVVQRQRQEDAAHPFYRHLDRLVVQKVSRSSLQE